MATKFDKIFRPLAKRLIDDTFGTTAVLRVETSTFVVATGKTTVATVDTTVKIAPPTPVAESRISGVVQGGDAATVVAGSPLGDVRPTPENKLVWDNKTWQIIQVNPVFSGDEIAMFELIIRS